MNKAIKKLETKVRHSSFHGCMVLMLTHKRDTVKNEGLVLNFFFLRCKPDSRCLLVFFVAPAFECVQLAETGGM